MGYLGTEGLENIINKTKHCPRNHRQSKPHRLIEIFDNRKFR